MEAFLAKLRDALEDLDIHVSVGRKGDEVVVQMDRPDAQRLIDTLDKADDGIVWLAS